MGWDYQLRIRISPRQGRGDQGVKKVALGYLPRRTTACTKRAETQKRSLLFYIASVRMRLFQYPYPADYGKLPFSSLRSVDDPDDRQHGKYQPNQAEQ